ncbi:hypothetical protein AOLI_G00320330 [Acnodon oligacanthus]
MHFGQRLDERQLEELRVLWLRFRVKSLLKTTVNSCRTARYPLHCSPPPCGCQLLAKPGVNPAPSITRFQRRGDRPGTRPPGQGGGGSHALPAQLKSRVLTDTTPTAAPAIRNRAGTRGPPGSSDSCQPHCLPQSLVKPPPKPP